jgi:hypothetical protein
MERKYMLRRLLFTLAAIAAAPSMAQSTAAADEPNWVAIAATDKTYVEFLDLNSLAMRYGRLTALFLKNFDAPQSDARVPYQSMKALRMFDCSGHKAGAVAVTRYAERGGRGEVVDSQSRAPVAVYLTHSEPDSVGHTEIEFVCSLWEKRRALPSSAPATPSKPAAALRGALS